VRQVTRHRPLTEEQRCGDLAIRPALRRERGNAQLRRAQALEPLAPADARQLHSGRGGPAQGTERHEFGQRGLHRLAGCALLA